MSANSLMPQIGDLDVDAEVVRTEGRPLDSLLETLGIELEDGPSHLDLPADGWRVLDRRDSGEMTLGAPTASSALAWRVIHVSAEPRDRVLARGRVHPDEFPLRRSRSERAEGLRLRWAPLSGEEASDGVFVIDIVNAGEARWRPDGDPFFVAGHVARPGARPASMGFGYFAGQHPAVPLDPGEYARVQVSISDSQWASLESGRYELHAVLAGLPVRTAEPLVFTLTPQQIDRRASRLRSRRRTPADEVRAARDSHSHQAALLSGAANLEEVARAVLDAADTDEAVAAIARLLDRDESAGRAIVHSPLAQFTAGSVRDMRTHIAQIEKELDSLDG